MNVGGVGGPHKHLLGMHSAGFDPFRPIPLVEAPGPCPGYPQGHGVPGRAHLQDIKPFVDFVAVGVGDRGGGKRTGGEHSRAARRELRREPLRRAARRNEGRGIRDSARE